MIYNSTHARAESLEEAISYYIEQAALHPEHHFVIPIIVPQFRLKMEVFDTVYRLAYQTIAVFSSAQNKIEYGDNLVFFVVVGDSNISGGVMSGMRCSSVLFLGIPKDMDVFYFAQSRLRRIENRPEDLFSVMTVWR